MGSRCVAISIWDSLDRRNWAAKWAALCHHQHHFSWLQFCKRYNVSRKIIFRWHNVHLYSYTKGGGIKDSPKNVSNLWTVTSIFRFICAIKLKDILVITGGGDPISGKVDVYNENGHKEQFPNLRTPRTDHGCAHFVNSQNRVVSILCTIWL